MVKVRMNSEQVVPCTSSLRLQIGRQRLSQLFVFLLRVIIFFVEKYFTLRYLWDNIAFTKRAEIIKIDREL